MWLQAGPWLARNEGMEENMKPTIGFRVSGFEGLEKKMETTMMGYTETTTKDPFLLS